MSSRDLDEQFAVTRVTESVKRSAEGVCKRHAELVAALEPGDYIVNFNWDTIAADALYHRSRLWHPSTGFRIG